MERAAHDMLGAYGNFGYIDRTSLSLNLGSACGSFEPGLIAPFECPAAWPRERPDDRLPTLIRGLYSECWLLFLR